MRTHKISQRLRLAARQGGTIRAIPAPGHRALVSIRGFASYRSWHRLYSWMTVMGLSVTVGGVARAQGGGSPSAVSAGAAAAIEAMKGDLRRLVSANEIYRAKNKRYAGDVAALVGYRPSGGVTVSFLSASAAGWAGKATAAALPGKSCVISVGTVPTPPKTDATGRSAPDAVVVCDAA